MKPIELLFRELAPYCCVGCQATGGQLACPACYARLIHPVQTCLGCNRLSPFGRSCANCRRKGAIHAAVTVGRYEETLAEAITRYKYEHALGAAAELGRWLAMAIPPSWGAEIVTVVPSVPRRSRARGFDHARLLGQQVARQLGLPLLPLLSRSSWRVQTGAAARVRRAQVEGVFTASPIQGQRVLLVDDVITTGATVSTCAQALKAAGASRVYVAALARRHLSSPSKRDTMWR